MYTKDGFYKALEQKLGDDAYILLAGGGTKKLADLLTAASLTADGNSTKLSVTVGGTTKTGSVTVPYASKAGQWYTAKTLTIGSKGKSVDGSANVSWTLAEIGAAAAGHTHNNIVSLGNKSASDLSSTYPSGLSNHGIYNNGYPFTYGCGITSRGNGGAFQIAGQWNSSVTGSDNYDYPTEMYIRGRRDSYDVWTTWSRVITNRNYTDYTVTKTGGGASGTWGINITGNAGYATKSTYVYADNSPYRVTDSSPYYMHMSWNTNSDSMWYLRAYPETPKTIAVDYAYKTPWSGITGKPSSYTPSSHTHDDRYYTESEADNRYLIKIKRLNSSGDSTNSTTIPPSLLEFKNGYPLHPDPEFAYGTNEMSTYDNNGSGATYITRQTSSNCGNSTGYVIRVISGSGATPGYGGWYFGDYCTPNTDMTCIFRALIPNGVGLEWASNSLGSGGTGYWLTNHIGTGKYEWYAYHVKSGTSSNSSTNFFYVTTPCTWYISFANTYINTYGAWNGNARYLIGDNKASSAIGALLHSGWGRTDTSPTGDTWLYLDTLGGTSTPWGIRHNQANNSIGFIGSGTEWSRIPFYSGISGYIGSALCVGSNSDPSYTLDIRGTMRSTGRIYANEWIEFSGNTGLYWPNNYGSHFFPNQYTTYGNLCILGSKGGYNGILFGSDTNYMNIMDSGTHKGLFQEGQRWIIYYNKDNQYVGIRDSSTVKEITLNGQTYIGGKTWINTTAGSEGLNVGGWVGTTGSCGWYSISHGGGIYMEDSNYVRTYNSKAFYVSNTGQHAIYTAGGFASANTDGYVLTTYYNGTWYGDTIRTHGNGNLSISAPGGSLFLAYNRGNAYFCGGSYYIDRSGYVYCNQYYTSSDRTKKTNIESIASIVPIRKFNWKENGSLSYGFIAQELVELGHEELVHGTEGNMTVNYDAALSLSIAKLSNYVETLEHTIKELQQEVKKLKGEA